MVYNALSVHTKIFSFAVSAPIIFVPSCNLCDPAELVASISYSLIDSASEKRINMSSWDEDVPIVVSVPKWIKCLVVGDIKVCLVEVGFPTPVAIAVSNPDVVVDALVVAPKVVDKVAVAELKVKVFPLKTVATNTWPKLFKDHIPGSNVTVDASTASPQPV